MHKLISFFKKPKIILFLILSTSAFIRLATLEKLMVFTPDESYILYFVQTLVKNFHILWVGVSALGFDFYMGPGWLYFLYPFVKFSKNDPLMIGIISSLIGVITTYVVYWFGTKLYSTKVGLIASLFYGLSSLIVFYDQQPYPNAVPLTSLLIAISLYMSRKDKRWLYLFAFCYGAVFHLHLSLVLLIFAGIYWILSNKLLNKKIFFVSTAIFLIVVSPMIVFDFYHNASNITAPLRVIKSISGEGKTKVSVVKKLSSIGRALSRVWYLDQGKSNTDEILYPCNTSLEAKTTGAKPALVMLSLVALISFFAGKNLLKDEKKRLFFILSLCFLAPYLLVSSINSVEYYLLGFFPLFFIMSAKFVTSLKKPFSLVAYILIALFLIHNTQTVFRASGDYGLKTKRIMINKVMDYLDNSTYSLSEEGGVCQGAAGWRYLYMSYGKLPSQSSEDRPFQWLWDKDEISKDKAKYFVVMEDKRVPKRNHEGYIEKITEGGFNAYIYEN